MGRIHLIRDNSSPLLAWSVLEEGADHFGAMLDGKLSQSYTRDVLQTNTMPELLHKIQDGTYDLQCLADKWQWYAILGRIDSRGRLRQEAYPHHRELHVLAGFIPQVCDFMIETNNYDCKWSLCYVAELWIALNEWCMVKVVGFDEAMKRARDQYIVDNHLCFEEVTA